MTIAGKLAHIEALRDSQPQLSKTDRVEYDRIFTRLCRAKSTLARAQKANDTKKIEAAQRAIARAIAAREQIVGPHVGHLQAPARIIGKFEYRWGLAGSHCLACEMILDHKDLSGPNYRTVRVLMDEGGPPTNPRSAPDTMGVAWFALAGYIEAGKIVMLDEEDLS